MIYRVKENLATKRDAESSKMFVCTWCFILLQICQRMIRNTKIFRTKYKYTYKYVILIPEFDPGWCSNSWPLSYKADTLPAYLGTWQVERTMHVTIGSGMYGNAHALRITDAQAILYDFFIFLSLTLGGVRTNDLWPNYELHATLQPADKIILDSGLFCIHFINLHLLLESVKCI